MNLKWKERLKERKEILGELKPRECESLEDGGNTEREAWEREVRDRWNARLGRQRNL